MVIPVSRVEHKPCQCVLAKQEDAMLECSKRAQKIARIVHDYDRTKKGFSWLDKQICESPFIWTAMCILTVIFLPTFVSKVNSILDRLRFLNNCENTIDTETNAFINNYNILNKKNENAVTLRYKPTWNALGKWLASQKGERGPLISNIDQRYEVFQRNFTSLPEQDEVQYRKKREGIRQTKLQLIEKEQRRSGVFC